jgi:hypothetical protein
MGIRIQVPKWSALVMLEDACGHSRLGLLMGVYTQNQFSLVGSPNDEIFDSWKGGVEFRQCGIES